MGNETRYIELKSASLEVVISTLGAELQSIKSVNGTDFLWTGDGEVWDSHAPILFPICGTLKQDKYLYKGKEYSLGIHGFAREMNFEIEESAENKAVLLLRSDEQTRKSYPFDFEFRVIFELDGKTLHITYSAKNLSGEDMYFAFGSHEGYCCPGGFDDFELEFEKEEEFNTYTLVDRYLSKDNIKRSETGKVLPLRFGMFDKGGYFLYGLNSESVTLRHKKSAKSVKVDFPGHDYLTLWSVDFDQKYICIEPWCGTFDFIGSSYNIEEKEGAKRLSPGAEFARTHSVTFEE